MANILFIIAPKNFRDEEFIEPRTILAPGNNIEIASTIKGECTGMLGAKATAKLTLKEALARISEYAAIIFVGGSGSNVYHNDTTAHSIARTVLKHPSQILAAICWASVTLAKAGVLVGKNMTGWVSPSGEERKIFVDTKAVYQAKDVVVDGRVVTASGPHAAHEFGEKIKEVLAH